MITLKNGDKWIIDDRELEAAEKAGISYEKACEGNLPETSVDDFVRELLDDRSSCFPRKLTDWEGGYWDCNFDPYKEVLGSLAAHTLTTDFFTAYEMPSGEVLVVYKGADSGGYDVTTKVATFASREEYMKAVSFKE